MHKSINFDLTELGEEALCDHLVNSGTYKLTWTSLINSRSWTDVLALCDEFYKYTPAQIMCLYITFKKSTGGTK